MLGSALGQHPLGSENTGQSLGAVTLALALAQPNVAPVFLFEVTCGKFAPWWTSYSGSTYYTPETDQAIQFNLNGSPLTLAASIAAVESTPGTWYADGTNVYMQMPDSSDPSNRTAVLQYFLQFYWSDQHRDVNNIFWEGRVKDLPSLDLAINTDFTDPDQTSTGQISLQNTDNFFATRKDDRYYQWGAGNTVVYMGTTSLPWSQFQQIITQANTSMSTNGKLAVLNIAGMKTRLDVMYPLNFYTLAQYPNIRASDIGRCIQVVLGKCLGAEAVCIDATNRIFQMAGHPIVSIDAVRVQAASGGNVWNQVTPVSTNLALAQFTLSSGNWVNGQAVVCDLRGLAKTDGSGTLMENPSDQVLYLVGQTGATNINATSFAAAYTYFDQGYTVGPAGGQPNPLYRVTERCMGLYLDSQTSMLDTINSMCQHVRAYFFSDLNGMLQFVPFRLQQAKLLPLITDPDILGNWQELEPDTSTPLLSSFTCNYAGHKLENYVSTATVARVKNQYIRQGINGNSLTTVTDSLDSFFYNQVDATEYAGWQVNQDDLAPIQYQFDLKWSPWLWMCSNQVYMTFAEENINRVLEIIEMDINLTDRKVTVTAQTLRGMDNCSGFWVGDGETTPLGNPLEWNGQERPYKTLNTGTWETDQGYAMTTPTAVTDYHVSTLS